MCKKWVCLVIFVVFGVVAAPPPIHAQVENLALNPSFEEDEVILDDPAWEQWATWGYESGLSSTVEIDESEFIDGARSLKVLPTGDTNWYFIVLNLPVLVDVDKDYTISFWAKAEEPRPLTVQLKATDNSIDAWGATDFALTTEWAEYHYASNVLINDVKLEILCSGSETAFWLDFVFIYEGEYVPGIEPSGVASPGRALIPNPADASVLDATQVTLQWRPGTFAASHNVYFGESFDNVDQGLVEAISTTEASVNTSDIPAYAGGLTPGQVYYWRVEEVNDVHPDSPWTGDVWSFRVRPLSAWAPSPNDGVEYVRLDQELTWEHGTGSIFHTVYLSANREDVENAAVPGWPTVPAVYDPPVLEIGTTYYWRVDEMTMAGMPQKGDVWSFTTVPDVAVTDPDLLGWWTLDEGMGTTAVDWSGHGNHGGLIGSPQWTHGVRDGALSLAGGAHVEIPALNVSTNTATMTAWVRADGRQTDWAAILFSREGSAISGVGFGPGNELRYHWTDLYWDFATGIVAPAYEWFFVALVVEPMQATLYYDGTETLVTNAAAHDPDPFDGVLRIGQDWAGRDLQGTVDDVRFYNKALSGAEIAAVMRGDPLLAWDPTPAPDGVMDIRDVGSLRWSAGDTAASHDVYLGADREAVAGADKDAAEYQGNQTATSLSLAGLVELKGGDYSWRIDEVQADGTVHPGRVWTFTVLPYLLVDDFESYTDEVGERVFQTWIDGFGYTDPVVVEGNGTGSTVGNTEPPFAETRIVHGGGQSMPMEYDNTMAPGYSEADRTFAVPQDWTAEGVTTLVIHVRGAAGNTGRLYAKINGVRAPDGGDPPDIASTSWIAWEIDPASVGVNLTSVTTLTVGVDGGDTGIVYIDDIWLTKP